MNRDDDQDDLDENNDDSLNEVLGFGIGWFLLSYRWFNEFLQTAAQAKITPDDARPYIENMAAANQLVVDAADDLYKDHPTLYRTIFGAVLVTDVLGATAAKAKEVFFRILRKNMGKRGMLVSQEPKQIEDQGEP